DRLQDEVSLEAVVAPEEEPVVVPRIPEPPREVDLVPDVAEPTVVSDAPHEIGHGRDPGSSGDPDVGDGAKPCSAAGERAERMVAHRADEGAGGGGRRLPRGDLPEQAVGAACRLVGPRLAAHRTHRPGSAPTRGQGTSQRDGAGAEAERVGE